VGVILRDALPGSQSLYANGPFENCQVPMFGRQHELPSVNVCEAAEQVVSAVTCCQKNIYAKAKIFKSLH